MTISRRTALSALSIPVLSACSHAVGTASKSSALSSATHPASKSVTPTSTPAPAPNYHASTSHGMVSAIPATGRQVAVTIDDGVRGDVVRAYTDAAAHGQRVTFFANGCYDSWRQNKAALVAQIEAGHVVIGNHTFSHPALTRLSDAQIAREITRNERHFKNLLGIDLKPYVRPPYGYTNARVNRVLRELGYDHIVMWNGTLGDDQNISSARIVANATAYLKPGGIVIGHANHPGILTAMPKVQALISQRHLRTMTVKDVLR